MENPFRSMFRTIRHPHVQKGAAAAACGVFSILLTLGGVFDLLEFKSLDYRIRHLPHWNADSGSPGDIVLVLIDQSSLEQVSRSIHFGWPWPRDFYARMMAYLRQAGAKAVVFDMFFSEPQDDRAGLSGADCDAALVDATGYMSNIVHSFVLQRQGVAADPTRMAAVKQAAAFEGDTKGLSRLRRYTTGALPSPELAEAAAAIGFATQEPEADNICRRYVLLATLDGAPLRSQALAAAEWLTPDTPTRIEPGRLSIGHRTLPIDDEAAAYLRWYPAPEGLRSPFPHYSAYNVLRGAIRQEAGLDPELPSNAFQDRVVFIGSSAPGLFDNWATPLSKTTPGIEIQATALANVLRGEALTRIPRAWTVLLTALLAAATAAATGLGRRHTPIVIGIPLLLLAGTLYAGQAALTRYNVFLEIVPPAFSILSTFLVSTLVNYLTERRHSRMVRGIFEHYLDRSIVENLIADPSKVRLGGERRACTVLFTDVANFTTLSERLDPEQVVRFMNIYLDAMTDIIIRQGGFVDKYIGDEIVAVFGAPNPLPAHAACACRAVLNMETEVQRLQPAFREAGCVTDIFARTGLCTGEVIIGNMGSESRMNYTAMGNTMNLGARIQGISKVYGARILVSHHTVLEAGPAEFIFREIDRVRVKGKTQAEPIFELLGFNTTGHPFGEAVSRYAAALGAYRERDWNRALDLLEPLEAKDDGPSRVLAARCREYRQTPPPADWEGISTMLTK